MDRSEVLKIIYEALDLVLEGEEYELNERFVLFGNGAIIDSLDLVSVIVDVESEIGDIADKAIALTDDQALSQEVSPFDSVKNLADYIMILIMEE
jgi:acyl carrier protein